MPMKLAQLYIDATKHRGLYYIVPIDNLPSILKRGILSNKRSQRLPHSSVALEDVQERRERVKIPNGLSLHEYVNLYFDPRNPMMYLRREKYDHICVLRISFHVLELDNVVVADRNAARGNVLFCTPMEGLSKLDFQTIFMRTWTSPNEFLEYDQKGKKCAEVLVPFEVSREYINCALVANDVARQAVEDCGFSQPISVFPDIFFR